MKVNYHTHTSRCGHATGTDEQYVCAAIRQGFDELGFSDMCRGRIRTGFPIPACA